MILSTIEGLVQWMHSDVGSMLLTQDDAVKLGLV